MAELIISASVNIIREIKTATIIIATRSRRAAAPAVRNRTNKNQNVPARRNEDNDPRRVHWARR